MWAETALVREDMIIVSYEAMHEDAVNCLRVILNFFGCPRSEQKVQAVVERNRFDAMQAREITGEFHPRYKGRLGAKNPNDSQSLKCRKGRVGGYRDELSSEDIIYCDSILENLAYFDHLGITPHDASSVGGDTSRRPGRLTHSVGGRPLRNARGKEAL
jgi:hypothetical protein